MLIFLFHVSYALNLDCNPNTCENDRIGDGTCSPSCMIEPCNYDSSEINSFDKFEVMFYSDCYEFCISLNCTYELLGNDKCDDGKMYTECNIQECAWDLGQCGFCAKNCYEYMLGDGNCDEECNIAECRYDWNDCGFCAKKCYEYMLGDGNCDEECNIAECQFDLNDCRLCAEGCSLELINNGICDPECYNENCEYDGKDCGCAPNCKLEDYGKCKPECMVLDCNYDSIGNSCQNKELRDFYKYWQLLSHDFSVIENIDFLNCSYENSFYCQIYNLYEKGELWADNSEFGCLKWASNSSCVDCDYLNGYMNFFDTCVKSCPWGYSNHSPIPSICYRNQESVKIYVDYNTNSDILNGSQEYPYKTLYDAISEANSPFIEILLKPGIHEIDYEIPFNPYIRSMTIKSDCKIECAEYAFLNITNSSFSFPTAWVSSITFLNLIIDRKNIDNPYMIYATDIKNSEEICPQLDNINLIKITAKSKFYVENVTFQNMQYNLRSIINAEDSRIELYNVDFINIITFHCLKEFSVVILSGDSNFFSSFLYEKGKVFLNNMYTSSLISFGSNFLTSEGFNYIKITDIEFQDIWVFGVCGISSDWDTCKSLFCIHKSQQVAIINNKFNNIYAEYHLFDIELGSDSLDLASYAIVNNNRIDYIWSMDVVSLDVFFGASYIFITNLNIFGSVIDRDIIEINGWKWDTEAKIENIWIRNSSFYKIIKSQTTKSLEISSIYTENLENRKYNIGYYNEIFYYLGYSSYESMHDIPELYLDTFISGNDGIISISNITVNKASFADINNAYLSFAYIINSTNALLKNIKIDDLNIENNDIISILYSKQIYINNLFLKNVQRNFDNIQFMIEECWNVTIFSSYFNSSTVFIRSQDEKTLFDVYYTIFADSAIFLDDYSKGNSFYQFINCSFLNNSYHGAESAAIYSTLSPNSLILTKNCIFKFNSADLLHLDGGSYQDVNSVFEKNSEGFEFEDNKLVSTYTFTGSKFYDNTGTLFNVEDGIMNFNDCNFARSGDIRTESSLYIINSTFHNISEIDIKGNQSYIRDCYFYIYIFDGINFIDSSSLSLEIYNSTFMAEDNYLGYNNIINIQGNGSLLISNTNFTILSSHQSIINFDEENNAKIENSYFYINKAEELGSVIFNTGDLIISNISVIKKNELDNYYLPFLYANNTNTIEIENSRFDGFSSAYLENTDLIKISRSSFKNIKNSQALNIINYNKSYLTDLEFINNMNNETGVSLNIINNVNKSYMIIDNCTFNNNQGDFGGAILIDGCDVTIKNSKFLNNTAKIGGAIVSACWNSNLNNYLINNTFKTNSADIGGAVYWEGNYQNVSNNTFIDNHALYGNITASQPVKLAIIQPPHRLLAENQTLESNLICSLDYDISFQAALVDLDNQVISRKDYKDYSVSIDLLSSNVSIVGNIKEYSKLGVFNFTGLKFMCHPGSEILLNLSCTEKFYNYFHSDKAYELPPTTITIKTRNCKKGEYNNENVCEYCKEGKFSLDPNNSCETCPKNAYCYGGNQIAPDKGYWHGNVDSSIIYACPNPDACKGGTKEAIGNISLIGLCSEGYRGNLCQPCDFHYSSSGRNKCEKCPANQATNATKIFAISIAMILALACVVYFTLKTAYEPKSTISIYCRILINYLQMITLITRLKLNWPFYIDSWLLNQGYPGEVPTHILSIDCYLMDENDPDSYKTVYFKKMILVVLLPAFLGVSAFIFWSFIAIFQRNWKMMKIELIATLCIILFLILPSITDYMFSIYNCTNIYGELYLVNNLDIKCWEGDHLHYALAVALPGIIVWTLGIPACVFLFLRKRQFKLHKLDTKLRFGFLYNGYHETTYYWEFIVMLRKLMIICLTVFLTTGTIMTQTASCASIFAIFYFIQYRYYPFEYENLNKTELGSNFVILITTWCGLFYTDNTPNQIANVILFFCILSSNAYFVFMWARMMIIELILLAIELFPYFKNYFDENDLKLKKSSEMKSVFSLIKKDKESKIEIKLKNKIENSVDLSIFKIKENIEKIEEKKVMQSMEFSGKLCTFETFMNSDAGETFYIDN